MLQKVKSFLLRLKKQNQSDTQSKQSKQETSICKICFKNIEPYSLHSILFCEPKICHKCFEQFNPVLKEFHVQNYDALHIFHYDDTVKEKLYQLKGCFDIEIASVFLEYFLPYLNIKYRNYYLVPAPSFVDSDNERGFNHVEEIFKTLSTNFIKCIHKTKDVKQADLNSSERSNIKDALTIDDVNLSDKKILIVDDVFTTGSTVNAMIDLLKTKNPKKIKILVMSKTKDIHMGDIK